MITAGWNGRVKFKAMKDSAGNEIPLAYPNFTDTREVKAAAHAVNTVNALARKVLNQGGQCWWTGDGLKFKIGDGEVAFVSLAHIEQMYYQNPY